MTDCPHQPHTTAERVWLVNHAANLEIRTADHAQTVANLTARIVELESELQDFEADDELEAALDRVSLERDKFLIALRYIHANSMDEGSKQVAYEAIKNFKPKP